MSYGSRSKVRPPDKTVEVSIIFNELHCTVHPTDVCDEGDTMQSNQIKTSMRGECMLDRP